MTESSGAGGLKRGSLKRGSRRVPASVRAARFFRTAERVGIHVSLVGAVLTCGLILGSEGDAAAQAAGAAGEGASPAVEPNTAGGNAAGAGAAGSSGDSVARAAGAGVEDTTGESGPPGAGLSGAQLRERADGVIRSIAATKEQIGAMLGAAREKRDVVKVLCLDDKSEQVAVALTAANDRKEALDDALLASAAERAQHEFTLLTVLKERVDTLSGEAGQCVGEETGFTGDSELTVAVDPNLPETGSEPPPVTPPPPSNLSTALD